MKKTIFLPLAAAAIVACTPRAGGAGAASTTAAPAGPAVVALAQPASPAQPAAAPAPAAGAGPAASREQVRDLLLAAGLGVPKEPIEADDFELASLAGGEVKLSDYRGRVVFLNFWATWCPPCRAEMPSMERLHQRLAGRGLAIVAVDLREPRGTVQKFVKDNSLTFTVLLDASGAVGGAWGAQSIPTTYLIDRKGNILARSVGSREWDSADMAALFETLLATE